jgi:hypothetical protein
MSDAILKEHISNPGLCGCGHTDPLRTDEQSGARLGVKQSTIRKWRQQGAPRVYIGQRAVRSCIACLVTWLAERAGANGEKRTVRGFTGKGFRSSGNNALRRKNACLSNSRPGCFFTYSPPRRPYPVWLMNGGGGEGKAANEQRPTEQSSSQV